MKKKTKCIFFDRDNTLIYDEGYTYKPKDLKWKRGVIQAIKLLNKLNYLVIVISNQSGVARNYFKERDVKVFHNYMREKLLQHNAKIDDFFYCPYHEDGIGKYKKKSKNRKPNNGMIIKAVKKWNINLSKSYFVGDQYSDYQAARKSNIEFYWSNDNMLSLVKKIKNISAS